MLRGGFREEEVFNLPKDLIRVMLDELRKDGSDLSHVQEFYDSRGYTREFLLPKDLTLTLVTGYDVKRRHAINKRWMELESLTYV